MGSPQDFRSLQAKFQATQSESAGSLKKPPKSEFNKVLKKFPPPELSEHPQKPPEFSVGSRKALQPEFPVPPKKPSQPEFPRKPPQPEFPEPPSKPPQPEFPEPPWKLPQGGFPAPPKKPSQPKFPDPPRKLSQPEFPEPPSKLPQPEFPEPPWKLPQPEFPEPPSKLPQPEFPGPPSKLPQPEFPEPPWKLTQPEFPEPPSKLPQPEFPEPPWKLPQPAFPEPPSKLPQPEFPAPPKKPSQPEFPNTPRKSPQPEFPEPHRKLPQPEFPAPPKKPSQPELPDLPRKPPQPEFPDPTRKPPQPEFPNPPSTSEGWGLSKQYEPLQSLGKAPQQPGLGFPVCTRKQRMSEPTAATPWPEAATLPRKASQPAISNPLPRSPKLLPESGVLLRSPQQSSYPQKPSLPQVGHLPRTASEPQVGDVLPRKPQAAPFQARPRNPPDPAPGGLPRTTSEPEFQQFQGKPFQPQTHAWPQIHPQAEYPRKPRLPASMSESSLPSATGGLGSQFRQGLSTGRLRPSGGSSRSLQASPQPRRRPLPAVSSLGPPPVKPPLPPGPRNLQSYRSLLGTTTVRRAHSAAGMLCQTRPPRQPRPDPDEIYELYDDVGSQEELSPMPKAAAPPEKAPFMAQPPRRPPREPELRKKAQPQPPPPPAAELKSQKLLRKAEKAEREFRKKFKFEGEIVIQTKMMIDPNAKTRRGGGKHLGIRRGEILEVIEFTNKDEMLCRDAKGKYGYVPRTALLPLETEVYDDVGFWDPMENQPVPRGQ